MVLTVAVIEHTPRTVNKANSALQGCNMLLIVFNSTLLYMQQLTVTGIRHPLETVMLCTAYCYCNKPTTLLL